MYTTAAPAIASIIPAMVIPESFSTVLSTAATTRAIPAGTSVGIRSVATRSGEPFRVHTYAVSATTATMSTIQ